MSDQIGNTDALIKYLNLEQENKRLLQENKFYYEEILKLRGQWGILAAKVNNIFNWLETRQDTKTETIRRKMAETFKFAYMESNFADMIVKWPCKESRDAATVWLKQSTTEKSFYTVLSVDTEEDPETDVLAYGQFTDKEALAKLRDYLKDTDSPTETRYLLKSIITSPVQFIVKEGKIE